MNFEKVAGFVVGAMIGSYLMRRYVIKKPIMQDSPKFEHLQNELILNKSIQNKNTDKQVPDVNSVSNQSPYAALYSNKK